MAYISQFYYRQVLGHPLRVLLLVGLWVAFFAYHAPSFRLDASADSLVLENDSALDYYRSVKARYGSDDFLVVTYSPKNDLFSKTVLSDLKILRDELKAIPLIDRVVSLLDVPLIQSPPVSLRELSHVVPTLESPQTDMSLARKEFLMSPLYHNLIISPDATTTALQIFFERDETWHNLLRQRDELRELQLKKSLSVDQIDQLKQLSQQFDRHSIKLQQQHSDSITSVRRVMKKHSVNATLHLGGVPMITADSIAYIDHDLTTFGVAVFIFLLLILSIAFKRWHWVVLPLMSCLAGSVISVGLLGLIDWPVTVVSSNFISLLLIITLSLSVHLIVRYRELHEQNPDAEQRWLVKHMLSSKMAPCFYTAITTIVAFGSLLFSGIRPVIDFGWMMSVGVVVAFILIFTLFPAALMLLKPGVAANRSDITEKITLALARLNKAYSTPILWLFVALSILSVVGMNKLSVENRFIDYFKKDTEIYQGMEIIDRQLGGTTPLDVIIDAPASFFEDGEEEWLDPLDATYAEEDAGITSSSYWFNTFELKTVKQIQQYLDGLPQTGKVLSLDTAMTMLAQIDGSILNDSFTLSLLYKRLPEDLKQSLIHPYLSQDGNQLRFSIRVFESDPSLKRDELLQKIRHDLVQQFGLKPEQVHLSGMLVLYNNMLQSLFTSQILTIGIVFVAILIMFMVLFRRLKVSLVTIVPNLLAAGIVLGLMGWIGIPLDLMTITIAAISIGIAVDDSIHYVHRFIEEFALDGDYWAAAKRSHASIGRAMYYTTLTVTLGFSVLALSNFVPTIYFGLLTGFAMLIALLANLTLLPLLLIVFKPLGESK